MLGNWKLLVKGVLIRERLKQRYSTKVKNWYKLSLSCLHVVTAEIPQNCVDNGRLYLIFEECVCKLFLNQNRLLKSVYSFLYFSKCLKLQLPIHIVSYDLLQGSVN